MRTPSIIILLALVGVVAPGAGAADWPMLAHDVGRSGATTEQVEPPVRRAWVRYFHFEGLMPSIQAIVVDGRVYFGTLAGNFYCLDAASGRDIWRYSGAGPVFHTACVTPQGLVVFGAGDGAVYALRTADGTLAWKYQTDAPIWNSPLPYSGRIYIGGRDGRFYCLNAADGALMWSYQAGAPICQSPALDARRNAVYFTDESMHVHALDATTGQARWRSEQLPGVTARSFHPVIAPDGTVMVNTVPMYNWDRCHEPLERACAILFGTEQLDKDATRYPGTYTKLPQWRHLEATNRRYTEHARSIMLQPDYFQRLVETLAAEIDKDPDTRCLFLLDPATGRQRAKAPVLYTAFAKSEFTPPLVTGDGRVMTKWWALLPSTFNSYQREVNMAWLDSATGRLSPLFDEMRLNSSGLGLIADESCQLSIAGRYLLNLANHHGEILRYFDLADPKKATNGMYYQTHSHWYGVGIIQRILRNQLDQIAPGQEDLIPGFGNMGYATGNHPSANMAVSAAAGRLFWLGSNKLMVLEPAERPVTFSNSENEADYGIAPLTEAELKTLYETWPIDWDKVVLRPADGRWPDHKAHTPGEITFPPGTRRNPDEQRAARAAEIADAVLDGYIWQAQVVGQLPDDAATQRLRAKLAEAVGELISQPRWRPYRFQGGKHPTDALVFFEDPSDTIQALALAWPWLDGELQVRVKAYVAQQWQAANPIVTLATYNANEGEAREFYRIPAGGVQTRILRPPVRDRGAERAYIAWLWGHNTGDWESVRAIWPALRTAHAYTGARVERDWKNAHVAGLIAACRLAARFGDQEALENNLPAARQALRERIAMELRFHSGNVAGDVPGMGWGTWPRWTNLTPEIGRALRERTQTAAPLAKMHLDTITPFWYLSFGPLAPSGRENSMQLPINNLAGFWAKAHVEGASAGHLRMYADVSGGRADPYWIMKAATALAAASGARWESLR